MTLEGNAFCPCGSGKKYKKCCGLSEKTFPLDPIAAGKEVAYLGDIGRRREAFCKDYTRYIEEQHHLVEERLKSRVAAEGSQISCEKGCASCCYLCVIASVQECEAIVYHLYRHEEALKHFLSSFKEWLGKVRAIRDVFEEIYRLAGKRFSGTISDAEEEALGDALYTYRLQDIPCPFLKEGACTIYEVRPFVCAGLIATTPPEWCNPRHPDYGRSNYLSLEPEKKSYVPYFANPEHKPCFSCLPFGVNDILQGSWGYLGKLAGCEWLLDRVKTEEEIQAVLRRVGG